MAIFPGGGDGNVRYENGYLVDNNGEPIAYESVTYAQFVHANFDVTVARHVIVTDKHSTTNSSDACGSLWWIEPTNAAGYKRVLRSSPIYYANPAAGVADWPYATYPAMRFFAANIGNNGAVYQASSTGYHLSGYYDIIRNHNVNSRRCTFPAATWTALSCSDPGSGGNTIVTGAGTHGLTQARCVTAGDTYVYVSGGTGWTVGWTKIVSVTESGGALALTLDTDSYNANAPTIILVGGAGADIYSATLPRYCIGPNGELDIDTTFGFEGTITSAPSTAHLLNSTQINQSPSGVASSHTTYTHNGVRVRNNGAYNSQIVPLGSGSGSNNANQNENGQTAALATAAVDFSAADVTLNIRILPGTANNVFWIRQLVVRGC